MRKKLKWYWKVLIIIAIMFIVGTFFNNGFIINVNAETNNDIPGIVIIDNDTGLPIQQTIPCNNKICSNFDYDFSTLPTYTNYMFWYKGTSTITNSGNYHSDFKGNNSAMSVNVSDSNIYYYRFLKSSSTGGITGIERGSHYSIVFSIYVDNLNYNSTILNGSDIYFKLNVCTNDSCGNDMSSHISNVEKSFLPPKSINDNENYAFFKIDFDTLPTYPSNTRIDTIEIGTKNRVITSGNIPNNYFFNATNGNSSIEVKQIVMVQDASTAFIPTTDYDSYFGLKSGEPLNNNSIYEDCSQYGITELDEAITCNTQNIFRGAKHFLDNILYNLVNLFNYIFVPSLPEIKQVITDGIEVVSQKLGFIGYPIDLLTDIVNRFLDLDPISGGVQNLTIHIDEVKDPIYNHTLIQAGDWAIGTILTTGTIGQLYNIYKVFITAYMIFLFICLCYDSFSSFIAGDGGRVSNFTAEVMNSSMDENPTGRELLYSKRTGR